MAASACRKAPPPPVPTTLVDDLAPFGHQLRAAPPVRATTAEAPLDVLIIGGGVAGLSAAWRLGPTSTRFHLLEVDGALGGTAQSGQNAVTAFPWGAHYLPAPLHARGPVPRLLRELDVLTHVDGTGRPHFREDVLIHEPEERLFHKGLWTEGLYLRSGASRDDLAELARFEAHCRSLARAKDAKGRRAFEVPTAQGSDDAEWAQLDRLSMADWLEREGYRSSRLRWLVDYACRDDFGLEASGTSAWAGLWYFTARQSGDERSEGYLSWPRGNGELVHGLAKHLGAERQSRGLLVHTLEREGALWHAHAVDRSGAPRWLTARQVVLAVPRFIATRVVREWREAPPRWASEFHTGPWVVANLTLSRAPRSKGCPLAWDNVLYESKSLGYVDATHQRLRSSPTGPRVWTWYYPLTGDAKTERTRLLATTAHDWADVLFADLARAHPELPTLATSLEVRRWGHAMVRPRPGFVFGGARLEAQASLHGSLHPAHSDLGGLALFEEANHFGVRAAERALEGLGTRVESWL